MLSAGLEQRKNTVFEQFTRSFLSSDHVNTCVNAEMSVGFVQL